jgi:RNA polymerase sigma-70 factor (ECF subfamily)
LRLKPAAPDHALIEQARQRQPEAFRKLFEIYKTPVYNFVARMIGQPQDAEDVVQEVFVKIYNKLATLRETRYFTTWLFSIAKHEAFNFARKHRNRKRRVLADSEAMNEQEETAPLHDHQPEREIFDRELDDLLQEALNAVPEINRAAFILGVLEEYSYKEVAEMLGCSENNVKSRVFRARAVIGEKLGPYLKARQPAKRM